MYRDRRILENLLEEALEGTFWPVLRLKEFCPTWAVGVRSDGPARASGRIWAIHAGIGRHLSIGMGIAYRSCYPLPIFFPMPWDQEEWPSAIRAATRKFAHLMESHEVRWADPERGRIGTADSKADGRETLGSTCRELTS